MFDSTKQEGSYFPHPESVIEPSCIILGVDGSMVEEKGITPDMVMGNPELAEKALAWGNGSRMIAFLNQDSIKKAPRTSRLVNYLGWLGCGLMVLIVSNPNSTEPENTWTKSRGISDIRGEAFLFAIGCTKGNGGDWNVLLNTVDGLALAEEILGYDGKSLQDAIFFRESARIQKTIPPGEKSKVFKSCDDTGSFRFQKSCGVCHKKKVDAKITACPCHRVYYCSSECQKADWTTHRKFVHKGIFLGKLKKN